MKRKNEDMEVDKGKALSNAFISMEDLFREHKEKADRENDDVFFFFFFYSRHLLL